MSWKASDIFLFSGSTLIFSDDINLPLSSMDPLFIFSNPAIVLNIVVFPIPEGPKRHITSPSFSIEKETSLTLVLPLTLKSTSLISKKFLLILIS